jgi:hypothetical protein
MRPLHASIKVIQRGLERPVLDVFVSRYLIYFGQVVRYESSLQVKIIKVHVVNNIAKVGSSANVVTSL